MTVTRICTASGKRPFRSRTAAKKASATNHKRIRVYICPACHQFHITTNRKDKPYA